MQMDPSGAQQYVLRWNGTRQYWTTDPWTGDMVSGINYNLLLVDDDTESYFADDSIVYRYVADVSGQVKGWVWMEGMRAWSLLYAEPKARCAVPRGCGAFGVCSEAASTACGCARGFRPQDDVGWSLGDYTGGCVRNAELQCGKNGSVSAVGLKAKEDRFFRMDHMRLPDDGRVAAGPASSGDCERACLSSCTCSAYAFNGSSCILWHNSLQNLEDNYIGRADSSTLYLRLAASEQPGTRNHKRRRTVAIAVGALVISCFVVAASVLTVRLATLRRRATAKVQGHHGATAFKYRGLQSFTRNFSDKLGGGALGSVFSGQLPDGTAIAVKKLEGLRQGEKQFRAEVSTLGTVRHVNLIRLLGFCSDGDKKLLVYECMPNGSLDRHLFGATLYALIWRARYRIAVGVAKGLAYLHDECRDRIIHCDVKP
jgi:hypothetical protein